MRHDLPNFVIVCENVSFHCANGVMVCTNGCWWSLFHHILPFLNPVEESLSAWRWKVYDHWPPRSNVSACCNGCCLWWLHSRRLQRRLKHVRRFFPWKYRVWPNKQNTVFSVEYSFSVLMHFCTLLCSLSKPNPVKCCYLLCCTDCKDLHSYYK